MDIRTTGQFVEEGLADYEKLGCSYDLDSVVPQFC